MSNNDENLTFNTFIIWMRLHEVYFQKVYKVDTSNVYILHKLYFKVAGAFLFCLT